MNAADVFLEKQRALRENRLNVLQEHAYRIDPGMKLARDVVRRELIQEEDYEWVLV